jgi:hypothetical protein
MTSEAIRAAILQFWLSQAGANSHHADALLWQAETESRLNPQAQSRSGHCLYQWVGSRHQELLKFARLDKGCPPLTTQLRFAHLELKKPWYACFWKTKPQDARRTLRRTFGAGAKCR